MERRPVIALTPLWDDELESQWMLPGYVEGIREAGAIPVIMPLTDDEGVLGYFLSSSDGFMLTGGHDVSPRLYGEEPLSCCEDTSAIRDFQDSYILKGAIEQGKAILGICRGIQLMNVALGGTLYQDLPLQRRSEVVHHMTPPYDRRAHDVSLVPSSPLHKLLGKETIGVNSYHHQAIKELAPALEVMATAEDGIVEAVCLPSHPFCWAVQWHPEFSYRSDEESRLLFKAFTIAAAQAL